MLKCIALLRKRPDLTRDEFIDYYENNHAPLMSGLFPDFLDYRRNYVDAAGAFSFAAPLDFDVVTELRFEDRAAYDRFVAKATDPDIARQIAEDEENVFDRGYTRMFVVEEKTKD